MAHLGNNLRYAVRTLRRTPGFSVVAILTLGLGIGANTAIFSVINAVILRPLPYERPGELVTLAHHYASVGLKADISAPGFLEYRKQTAVFSNVAAATGAVYTLTGQGDAARFQALQVVGDYFQTYGVQPALGRALRPDESAAGSDRVAVLSDRFWRTAQGSDPTIVGKRLLLNGESYEVVGVMPPSFNAILNQGTDLWTPLVFTPDQVAGPFGNEFLRVTARLRPGVSIEAAQAEMRGFASRLRAERPDAVPADWSLAIDPLTDRVTSAGMRRAMLLLMGAVFLVLLIACANVANLQLARAVARAREFSVRSALGASPGDLIRQLATESMVLALAGGGLGLLVAAWGVPSAISLNRGNLPGTEAINLDGKVLLFTLALSLATGILFGLAPARRVARTALADTLRQGGGAVGDRGGLAVRRALVIATVALALTLLVGAGLLTRSFAKLLEVDPGFRADHLLTFNIALPRVKYSTKESQIQFFDRTTAAVASLAGVRSAGATSVLPFTQDGRTRSFDIEGFVPAPNANGPWGDYRVVTPAFLATLGVRLIEGRFFTDRDVTGAPEVAIIDDELAAAYWPGESPLGKRLSYTDNPRTWITVVGVVGHTMHDGLDGRTRAQVYRPLAQDGGRGIMALAIRTTADPLAAISAVRRAVATIDPGVAIANVSTMDDLISMSTGPRRFSMVLLSVFSFVAAGLAALGLYGIMAFSVAQRTKELGVRLALGATPRSVQQLVMHQGLRLAIVGVGFGLTAAALLASLLAFLDKNAALDPGDRLLFNVSPHDPVTFVAIPILLLGVAGLASWIPARRATLLDPVEALRGE